MKRERESDDEASAPSNDARTGPFSKGYSISNPGYSFARPPGVQTKPSIKRPRVDDSNATTHNSLVKSEPEPEPERLRELSIQEDEEDLYGLEPGIGPSRHRNSTLPSVQTPSRHMSNLSDTQTPVYNNSNLRDIQTSRHSSHVSDVQTQAVFHHPSENNAPGTITGNGPSEDEPPIVTAIKEKLHKAISGLTVDEPAPPENPPPWGKHFALSGPCPKLINPALTIYGLGGIGLPLSERDAGLIAKFARPDPDPDTKMNSTVVDLTMSKVTEIAPHQVEMTNPGWEKAVVGVVGKLAKRLKVPGGPANVGLMPHNMTLYGPGDMLKEHREPKRGRGVFGTLAICLPSKHEGGDLSVTHGDQVKVLSTDKQSAFGYQYLFWHTELTCELTEVTLGYRLVLMYDLIDLKSRDKVDIPVSLEIKLGRLESALQFWKNNYSKLSSLSAKFLAYTLDNMYDEQRLSYGVLQEDDIQRVDALAQLCPKYGLYLYLAGLELRVRGGNYEGPTEEFLELRHVVNLDSTLVLGVAPCSASQIVQTNLSGVFNIENISDTTSDRESGVFQVYRRFVAILMPEEYCIDFCFSSVKSSATAMGGWIHILMSIFNSSNRDEFAKNDLKRACQLVLEETKHADNSENPTPDDKAKSICETDRLLGIVVRGGILLNDENICCEALREVTTYIPVSEVAEALKRFGFTRLLCELDIIIRRFKHIFQGLKTFIGIYNHYEGYKDSAGQAKLVTWMKSRAEQTFSEKHIRFKEDGWSIAKLGIICGEVYLKEILLPAVTLSIEKTEKLYSKKTEAVLRFLTVIADGHRSGDIGHRTTRHAFHCVLQVFIPRIELVSLRLEREGRNHPVPMKGDDILQLIRQCVSLELKHHMDMLFDKLDTLSRIRQSATTFEGFFLPLLKELDEIPAGQAPGSISQEFHIMARQLAENLREQHALHSPQSEHVVPVESQREDHDCGCTECLRLDSFIRDPTAVSVFFSFCSESRTAHHRKHQLPRITKGGFAHTCTVNPVNNGNARNYSITVRRTKDQLAVGVENGNTTKHNAEKPKPSNSTAKTHTPEARLSTRKTPRHCTSRKN
ncbi:hypothetical protein V490_03093 [Pseudogymnoascus sp. VKM F-3557]|nr:hypothetical protein V490_03093 [Pseudogymnoascus sp. VKM F-3557]